MSRKKGQPGKTQQVCYLDDEARAKALAVSKEKTVVYQAYKDNAEPVALYTDKPTLEERDSSTRRGQILKDIIDLPHTPEGLHAALWSIAVGAWKGPDKEQVTALRALSDAYKAGIASAVKRESAQVLGNAIDSLAKALADNLTVSQSVKSADNNKSGGGPSR